jgi:metallo-beta-lactamase family protein
MHLIETGNGCWMIDCGAHYAEESPGSENHEPAAPAGNAFPVAPERISGLILTHAHGDHIGRLPEAVAAGYRGPIFLTPVTAMLCEPALRSQVRSDLAASRVWVWSKIGREAAEHGRKALPLHWQDCEIVRKIAAEDRAECETSGTALRERWSQEHPRLRTAPCDQCVRIAIERMTRLFQPLDYGECKTLTEGVTLQFLDAGHVPGSASALFSVKLPDGQRRVIFSGDLGHEGHALFGGPAPAPNVDAVFVEATYGATRREGRVVEERALFRKAVAAAAARRGVVWIPAFALDRTQKVLYELRLAQRDGLLPPSLPIYCPSPTAKEFTQLYRQNQQRGWFAQSVAEDRDAFAPKELHGTVPAARALPRPCIVVSTSDITRTEWMRRLLSELLPERSTTMLLVSYHDPSSAAGQLKAGATTLVVDETKVAVRAKVESFACFSGHGDANDIDAWMANIDRRATVVLVHGGAADLAARAADLREQRWGRVMIAAPNVPIDLCPPPDALRPRR